MRAWILAVVVTAGGCEKESAAEGDDGVELGKIGDGGDAAKKAEAPKPEAQTKSAQDEDDEEADAAGGVNPVAAFSAAKRRTACVEAQMLVNAAEMFQVMEGKLPGDVAALKAKGVIPKAVEDPWDNDYTIVGPTLTVTSAGPDEKMGTADDISVEAGVADPCKGI